MKRYLLLLFGLTLVLVFQNCGEIRVSALGSHEIVENHTGYRYMINTGSIGNTSARSEISAIDFDSGTLSSFDLGPQETSNRPDILFLDSVGDVSRFIVLQSYLTSTTPVKSRIYEVAFDKSAGQFSVLRTVDSPTGFGYFNLSQFRDCNGDGKIDFTVQVMNTATFSWDSIKCIRSSDLGVQQSWATSFIDIQATVITAVGGVENFLLRQVFSDGRLTYKQISSATMDMAHPVLTFDLPAGTGANNLFSYPKDLDWNGDGQQDFVMNQTISKDFEIHSGANGTLLKILNPPAGRNFYVSWSLNKDFLGLGYNQVLAITQDPSGNAADQMNIFDNNGFVIKTFTNADIYSQLTTSVDVEHCHPPDDIASCIGFIYINAQPTPDMDGDGAADLLLNNVYYDLVLYSPSQNRVLKYIPNPQRIILQEWERRGLFISR